MRHRAHKTIPQVLEAHYTALKHDLGVKDSAFALGIREHYLANYPDHSRTIEFSIQPDIVDRMKRDAEKVMRYITNQPNSRCPAELLESIIASFPEERRFPLQMELAKRQHLMVFPLPNGTYSEDLDMMGKTAKEVGEALQAIGELLATGGVIDAEDAAIAPQAIEQIEKGIAMLYAARHTIKQKALGE